MRIAILTLTLALGLADGLAAQRKPRRPKTAAEALARFEKVRDDAKRRWGAVKDLGRFPDQEVTSLLLDELSRTDDLRYRQDLANALGAVVRQGALVALEELLFEVPGSGGIRKASAGGIARQGERGIARLAALLEDKLSTKQLDRIKKKDELKRLRDVRKACLDGLALGETEVAANALAGVVLAGVPGEQRSALEAIAKAEPSKQVTAARVRAATSKDLHVAALAAGQLTAHDHARGLDTVLRVHRKLKAARNASGPARAALIRAMVPLLERNEVFDPFVRQASTADPDVAKAVDGVAKDIGQYESFQRWLVKAGLKRSSELERCLVIRLLTYSPESRVTKILCDLMRSQEPAIVYTAARALGRRGDREAVPTLQKMLRAPGGDRRIEALFGLQALEKGQPDWPAQLLALLDKADRPLRATALDFLAELGSKEGLRKVYEDLDDKDWALRAAAYDYCRAVRSSESIPRLIPRVDRESGRLREDVLDTLQSLTARRYQTSAHWEDWWRKVDGSFELIPDPKKAKKKQKDNKREKGRTVTYYDLPLISERVTFVVDTSGSMKAKVGTSKKRTRLGEAKRQLSNVVQEMAKNTKFNLVFFDHGTKKLFKVVADADRASRAEALERIEKTKAGGGTNVFAALQSAFADPDIDTIYLLSDGYPSAGEIQDANALADEVARWNRTRQVRIHCIAIGADSGLLRRLAEESGGKYAHFK